MAIDYRCPECGSREVTIDASCRWDLASQTWAMSDTYDMMTCTECGEEGYPEGSGSRGAFQITLEEV